MTVKFTKRTPRLWLGNGFGHKPAVWNVLQNNRVVGRLEKSPHGYWAFRCEVQDVPPISTAFGGERLAIAKGIVTKSLAIAASKQDRQL